MLVDNWSTIQVLSCVGNGAKSFRGGSGFKMTVNTFVCKVYTIREGAIPGKYVWEILHEVKPTFAWARSTSVKRGEAWALQAGIQFGDSIRGGHGVTEDELEEYGFTMPGTTLTL